jgi:predicted nucleotidyltransferase
MLSEFRKFKGWVILEFFINHPNTKIHFKEVVRTLKISPRTAFIYLKMFRDDGIMREEKVGNLTIFSLNNELPAVRGLKKTFLLLRLNELKLTQILLDKNPGIVSFALYGSYADGSYDEKSDIDFLLIERRGEVDKAPFREVEELTKKDVLITCMSPVEWREMAERKDPFYLNVIKNHVLLHGAGLMVG